jgi:UDP-glucose 4-epimerase
MRILVIGGAGYICSHMVKHLWKMGCHTTTLDDLSSGSRDAVLFGDFIEGSYGDSSLLDRVLGSGFDAVMHFGSYIEVGESIIHPSKYY